jgi:hypothetical protein
MQINKRNKAHTQNQKQKSYDHLNRYRKGHRQDSTFLPDKNPEQSRKTKNIP